MIKIKDIVWLAGLLEGEGCFSISEDSSPIIAINMTDYDIIKRARDLMCPNNSISLQKKDGNRKDQYRITCCGNPAIQWMMTIYCLMGERRRIKIKEILTWWKAKLPNKGYCRKGHKISDDNAIDNGQGRLICKQCREDYSENYYKNNKELVKLRSHNNYKTRSTPEMQMAKILMKTKNISLEEALKLMAVGLKNESVS